MPNKLCKTLYKSVMNYGVLALLNPIEFFHWGISLSSAHLHITAYAFIIKVFSWTKLSGKLKTNFGYWIKEVPESCAMSQKYESIAGRAWN